MKNKSFVEQMWIKHPRRTVLISFISLLFVIIPCLVCIVNEATSQSDMNVNAERIMFYDMPSFRTSVQGNRAGHLLSIIIGSKTAAFGHGGIIIEDENGNLTGYDFGRFKSNVYGYKLPSSKGNWRKHKLGNRKGMTNRQLAERFGELFLNETSHGGKQFNLYIMKTNKAKRVERWIQKEANNPKRRRYNFFTDYTCGGAARDAFDEGRSFFWKYISKITDNVNDLIPSAANIWSVVSNDMNCAGLTGFSPEGNAPLIGTKRYRYVKEED